ncbi:DUF29 family protein [Roseomonas sp. E05]|uniref:DUF29 family protein n=1 Tax=Roseomonas sp. E05 TaxID=3046310 RepID=UPI0024B9EF76|nr:DUF29 family protein [Roseomonas sp. E05]MDJ0391536.1 DUF29 family protein [Roseomonas sp. E05]
MVGSTPAAHAAALYEQDFVEWTRRQAAALRAAQHGGVDALELDYEHLAQEIERVGESRAGLQGVARPTGRDRGGSR